MERFGLKRKWTFRIKNRKIIILKPIFILIVVLIIIQLFTNMIKSSLYSLCKAKVEGICITVSNKAIDDVMNEIKYEDLIIFDKDSDGKIIALKSNVVEMNNISSEIAIKIQEIYDELDDIYVYVPLRQFYRQYAFSRTWTRYKGENCASWYS